MEFFKGTYPEGGGSFLKVLRNPSPLDKDFWWARDTFEFFPRSIVIRKNSKVTAFKKGQKPLEKPNFITHIYIENKSLF